MPTDPLTPDALAALREHALNTPCAIAAEALDVACSMADHSRTILALSDAHDHRATPADDALLERVETAARAATPGPWVTEVPIGHAGVMAITMPGAFDWVCHVQVSNSPQWEENARYIATVDPATVLQLVERLRQAEAALREIRSIRDDPEK